MAGRENLVHIDFPWNEPGLIESLETVCAYFGEGTVNDVETDLMKRGVSEEAVRTWAHVLMDTLREHEAELSPGAMLAVIVMSSFHVGMLAQDYVTQLRNGGLDAGESPAPQAPPS